MKISLWSISLWKCQDFKIKRVESLISHYFIWIKINQKEFTILLQPWNMKWMFYMKKIGIKRF